MSEQVTMFRVVYENIKKGCKSSKLAQAESPLHALEMVKLQ